MDGRRGPHWDESIAPELCYGCCGRSSCCYRYEGAVHLKRVRSELVIHPVRRAVVPVEFALGYQMPWYPAVSAFA